MPDDRFQRWVDASSAAGAIEPFMIPLVQGLGRFDCHLINEDARFAALNQEQSSSSHESTRLADRLTLSYFWVLAAFELVRTLDQRWRTGATTLPDESGNRGYRVEAQDGTAADSTRKNGDIASISDGQCHCVPDN